MVEWAEGKADLIEFSKKSWLDLSVFAIRTFIVAARAKSKLLNK
jgi:hypothetical protein